MKNFLVTFKDKIIYIGRMFRVLWENDKKFLFFVLTDVILSASTPFVSMTLAKYSINMLASGTDYVRYLSIVVSLLLLLFLLSLLQAVVSSRSGILGNMIGDKLFRNIFNKTMEIDYELLLDKNVLEKRKLAMQVIEQGRFNNLVGNFKQLVSNVIILSGIIYLLSSIEFWILILVVLIVVINSTSTSARKKAERLIHTESIPVNRKIEYFWTINSDFSYGKEIRTYDMKQSLNAIHKDLVHSIQKYVENIFGLQLKGNIIYQITYTGLNAIIYLFLGYKIIVKKLISIGDFSLYLNAITTFNSSVQAMIAAYIDISNNGQYIKDYFDFIELSGRADSNGIKLEEKDYLDAEIVFENVSFIYPNQEKKSLSNINLTIKKGERISIVGENGAGKTTFIKLLLRLYEPTEGRILFNGIDIRDIDYQDYQKIFSTVFQDYKLFAFRIIDNITSLEGNEAVKEKVMKCLEKAGLSSKIEKLEHGLDTYLYNIYDEEGIELSGGESQKLAIARALYKDSPIVILDEPTAALDPRAEYEIYTRFLALVESKTSIFISHRLSSTKFCDRIVLFKDGSIEETGTHNELLQKGGLYAELFRMQAQFYFDN